MGRRDDCLRCPRTIKLFSKRQIPAPEIFRLRVLAFAECQCRKLAKGNCAHFPAPRQLLCRFQSFPQKSTRILRLLVVTRYSGSRKGFDPLANFVALAQSAGDVEQKEKTKQD